MALRMTVVLSGLLLSFLLGRSSPSADAAAPGVIISSPDNGEVDVNPAVSQIRVEFDQPMDPKGRSMVGGGEDFPTPTGPLTWRDERTLVIPVALQPEHEYRFSINSDTFKGFRSKAGEAAEWYPVYFKTRAAGVGAAKPDVTPAQNLAALAALNWAIDQDYAYRDRKKIDWDKEIAARQAKFEKAKSVNEFARLPAHLLRLAEDAHVSVQAGDVRIGTRANSTPPNVYPPLLPTKVPEWQEQAGGLVTGRFDAGGAEPIGYILFSQCNREQANAFDAALDEMKDTHGLIIDARLNSGGEEDAALQVAGRFVEKASVYSRDRLREGGRWKGPFDRLAEPRKDAERYAKQMAVLIGPKVASSAESFALMMKHGAGATLIGEPTKGSSGRPVPHQLGNGVTVYLSSWEDQLPDGTLLEGHGVKPDKVVKLTPREWGRSDPVIDAALQSLHGSTRPDKF